jgi:hypothetical protein
MKEEVFFAILKTVQNGKQLCITNVAKQTFVTIARRVLCSIFLLVNFSANFTQL